jgi:hypothetical protein
MAEPGRRDAPSALEPPYDHGHPHFRFDAFWSRLRRGRRGGHELLAVAAADWRLPVPAIIAILLMPVVVCLVPIVAAGTSQGVYKVITMEDGPYEWAQFAFFLLAALLAAGLCVRHLRERQFSLGLLLGGATAALLFVAAEEIAWGQRLLGLEVSAAFSEINTQDDLTLHNIREVQDLFKWVLLVVGLYGTVAPMVAYRDRWLPRWRLWVSALVPHPVLIPSFAVMFVWRVYRNLFVAPEPLRFVVQRFAEVTELVLAIAIVLFFFSQLRNPVRAQEDVAEPDASKVRSRLLTRS